MLRFAGWMLRVAGWVHRVEEREVAEGLRYVVRDELHPCLGRSVAVAVLVAVAAARLVALAQVLQRVVRQPDDSAKVGVPLAEIAWDAWGCILDTWDCSLGA